MYSQHGRHIDLKWAKQKTTQLKSKSTIEPLEKGLKYVQSYQWKHQNNVIDVVLVFLLLTLKIFHTFFYYLYCWFWTNTCKFSSWLYLLKTETPGQCIKPILKLWIKTPKQGNWSLNRCHTLFLCFPRWFC